MGRHESQIKENFDENSLNWRCLEYKWGYMVALFFLGVFNNNGYTTVQTGAKSIAHEFHQDDFMGIF